MPSSPNTQMIRILYREGVLPPPKNSRMLDVGCWDGGNMLYFAKAGFRVNGTDITQKQLDLASSHFDRELMNPESLRLLKNNRLNYDTDIFDLIVCWKTLYWAGSEAKVTELLGEMVRVLKPEAPIILSTFSNYTSHIYKSERINSKQWRMPRYDGTRLEFCHFENPLELIDIMERLGLKDVRMGATSGEELQEPGKNNPEKSRSFRIFFGIKRK